MNFIATFYLKKAAKLPLQEAKNRCTIYFKTSLAKICDSTHEESLRKQVCKIFMLTDF